jgi:hypothetical protein
MLSLLRSVVAVIVGYIIFAASAFAVFRLSGRAAHADAPLSFMAITIVAGIMFALLGGYVAAWLAGRAPRAHGLAVAAILAVGAAVSLASTVGHGAIWSQVAALLLMAPSAALGGLLRSRAVA